MGTRADFYIGRGKDAQWLGSVAWDGYPTGIPEEILTSMVEEEFKEKVHIFLTHRDGGTLPDEGWPWPWDDSRTTDFAYAIDNGRVYTSCFGSEWADPLKWEEIGYGEDLKDNMAEFPDMKELRDMPPLGSGKSGIIAIKG